MSDKELVKEILSQVLVAVGRVERRMTGIKTADDFVTNDEGVDKLDAISMMLIAIGESCKNLDKVTGGELLPCHPEIDWKGVKGMRDIISHHYFDINPEIVYSVCTKHIPVLRLALEMMLREIG